MPSTAPRCSPFRDKLPAGLHRIRQAALLATKASLLLSTQSEAVCVYPYCAASEIRAFPCFILDDFASLTSGFRREQHADAHTYTQPEQEAGKSVLIHLSSICTILKIGVQGIRPNYFPSILPNRKAIMRQGNNSLDAGQVVDICTQIAGRPGPLHRWNCGKSSAAGRSGRTILKQSWRRLKESGYLNDRRFAKTSPRPPFHREIRPHTSLQELRQRSVARRSAESTVRQVYQDVNDEKLIEEWIRRKYRLAPREGLFREDQDLAAAYRRLLRAGFRSGDIVRVLKRFAKNPDLLDSLSRRKKVLFSLMVR